MIYISQDLAVVRAICERVLVFGEERVVESGPTGMVLTEPRSNYTRQLIAAIPALHGAPHFANPNGDSPVRG